MRARKRRAAASFKEGAFLHARAAEDIADRLEHIPRHFESVLELGGGGLFSDALARNAALSERIRQPICADVASGSVILDLENLPIAPSSFDLIVSPLVLHWANDLPGTLIQLRQALKPDGLLLASLFGGDTLCELRRAMLDADLDVTGGAGPRVSPFAGLQDLAHLLQRAGFALPAADRDVVTVRYADPIRLLADLRAMGETAALSERNPVGLSRRILERGLQRYRDLFTDTDGRARATFEIITLTGWAPHPSQQKPLAPGSAKARLAEALGAVEKSAGDRARP